jgi:hypothetical protein
MAAANKTRKHIPASKFGGNQEIPKSRATYRLGLLGGLLIERLGRVTDSAV